MLAQRTMRAAYIAASGGLLLLPALWNRYPLLQYDTGGYLARWFEGYLVPSRSTVYGILLWAGIPLNEWPIVALQAAAAVWIVGLVLRVHGCAPRPSFLLAAIAAMCVGTSLPWIASTLLTDIFSGLAVLALYLLVFHRDGLGSLTRAALFLFLSFCVATHSATFAVIVALLGAGFIGVVFRCDGLPARNLMRGVAAAGCGAAMLLTANFALSGRVAWTPGGYGILFGRLLQDGIVVRYLDEHCPDPQLKLCTYRHRLPQDADAFLWGEGIFNQLGRFAGLGEEMRRIVLGSLVSYPWQQTQTAVVASAKQLFHIKSGEGVDNRVWHTYGIIERYAPEMRSGMRQARQQKGEIDFTIINWLHVPIGLLSLLLLPSVTVWTWRRRKLKDLHKLSIAITLAVLFNAALCGILSNPHSRYGARLLWLTPFALTIFAFRTRMESESAREALIAPCSGQLEASPVRMRINPR